MGAIEDIYADLDAEDVSEEEFRAAVEAKVEQMGGLADEETAAMLVAHELADGEVEGVADVDAGMEEVKFVAKVTSVGDLRTFERDEEDREDGRVLNADVADETASIRVTFWDEQAASAAEELAVGDVLRVAGYPKEGYNGLEVSVDRVEPAADETVDVQPGEAGTVRAEDLTLGRSDVSLRGVVLGTDAVRTFERDDGSEGRVSNLLLGDETGRVRVTLWDERADRATELDPGTTVEVVDGYVREREGALELHVGDRGAVEEVEETAEYAPDVTPIADVAIEETVDLAGVVRSADPKRTFDRDDGSEGQVRNVRIQDDSGDIRVALWGEKADADVGPGDAVLVADVEIQDGWQDDLEASAGWQSTLVNLEAVPVDLPDGGAPSVPGDGDGDDTGRADSPGLDAFAESGRGDGDGDGAAGASAGVDGDGAEGGDGNASAPGGTEVAATTGDGAAVAESEEPADGERVEFTGVVVQAGDPVILDDGERTVSVDTTETLTLGEEVTVRGERRDGRVDADDVL